MQDQFHADLGRMLSSHMPLCKGKGQNFSGALCQARI